MCSMGDKTYIVKSGFSATLIDKFFHISPNAIYGKDDFLALINISQDKSTYIETIIKENLPDADTFHRQVEKKHVTLAELRASLLKKSAKSLRKIKGKYILIFDETYEPYFGKNKNKWIHEYKPANGCVGCFKFLCCHALTQDGQMIFLDAAPLSVFSNISSEVTTMLDFALQNNKNVFSCLFDRGYYNSKVIGILNRMKLNYLMLVPKKMKKLLDEHKNEKFFVVEKYAVGKAKTETRLVVYKNDDFDWVFATSMKFRDATNMIKLYKKRWNIETGFRVCDEARIKTKSMHIEVRYFFFLCGIVLYNLWKESYPEISFKRLIQMLANENYKNEWYDKGFAYGFLSCIEFMLIEKNGFFAVTSVDYYENAIGLRQSALFYCSNNGLAPVVC